MRFALAGMALLLEAGGVSGLQEPRAPETLKVGAELRAGLVAVYRSLNPGPDDLPLVRIDAKPAATWGDSSPHPRIAPGPFEAVWSGVFLQPELDTLQFGAWVGGAVKVTIGGLPVLEGRSDREVAWIEGPALTWRPGTYRIRVEYRSLPGAPARVQPWWEGKTFSREPLPPWRFRHLATDWPETAGKGHEIARGRAEVERLGCARCHRSAFPSIASTPPGPSLEGLRHRVNRASLLRRLEDSHGTRMPALFTADRKGYSERWILAGHLLEGADRPRPREAAGDPRKGKAQFLGLGCATCHVALDLEPEASRDPDRPPFEGLRDRMTPDYLAAFLQDPTLRYPDGRMPRIPVDAPTARDVAAYLLGGPPPVAAFEEPPTPKEIEEVRADGPALLREKNCLACHPAAAETPRLDIPLRKREGGCLSGESFPRFTLAPETRRSIAAYLEIASREKHPSPYDDRRQLLERRACLRCHQRDGDLPAPIEAVGSRLGTEVRSHRLPYQRTPRLTYALTKYRRSYLVASVRDGVSGVRPEWYSYKMPVYGAEAETIVRAIAEADGDSTSPDDAPPAPVADPVAHVEGPVLVGFEGYSCITCHLWKRENLTNPDPAAVGPELTTVAGRIRRDWFDRWLEDPARAHPGTPMPSVLRKGQSAPVKSVVYGGDADKQKEAIWDYLSKGKDAVSPKSPPPIPVDPPPADGPPLVAPIPIQAGGRSIADALCVFFGSHDLIVYDAGGASLENVYTGARILRKPRPRGYAADGAATALDLRPSVQRVWPGGRESPSSVRLHGYDRLSEGVRLRMRLRFPGATVELTETLRLPRGTRTMERELRVTGIPAGSSLELRTRPDGKETQVVSLARDPAQATVRYELPPARTPPATGPAIPAGAGRIAEKPEGALERPGYRAVAYPRPTTITGEDRVMPYSLAVDPRKGDLFVTSEKMGEVLVLRDERFENFSGGLFQQAYGLVHDGEGLTVLHRGALTRMRDTDGDGAADAFERIAGGTEWPADSRAFGLVRDRSGAYWFNVADNKKAAPGSAAALRLRPGDPPTWEDAAHGVRQAYGWCFDEGGNLYFTDNQGEWVATNKLCLLQPGRFYGFRNPEKKQHFDRTPGKAAVWIPYGWAKSVNGVDLDRSGGKFGPFAGQFFMAEMMYGGGLIRAQVEKVKGEVQGACFPFWGKGLLGPLVVAFDPKGRLYVGGMSEGECGSQPDRGALFRIDFTGETPFEIHSIHALPQGFRLVFTRPVNPASARDAASYAIEHFRYEYTGAYGSPELDRTRVAVRSLRLGEDGRTLDLETDPLVKDRVYLIRTEGVRSPKGEPIVNPVGAYTMNEVP